MPRRRIYDQALFAHFVTFSCYRRRKLLDLDWPKRIVLGTLNAQLRRQSATCIGFVIMPEHVHAIVWFPQTGQLSRFMHGWKRRSSYDINRQYRQTDSEYFDQIEVGEPFWQPKYYAFEIESDSKLSEKLTYIHLNPVRRGLVERAVDRQWSSARHYELCQTVGVEIGWVQ